MKLVPSDTPLDIPAICAICEGSPERPAEQVVDTEYQTRQGQILAGRKYVCERCIVEASNLLIHEVKLNSEVATTSAVARAKSVR